MALLATAATFLSAAVSASAVPQELSPEQEEQIKRFGDSLANQAVYGAPLVAMYLLRHSVCFWANAQSGAGPNSPASLHPPRSLTLTLSRRSIRKLPAA